MAKAILALLQNDLGGGLVVFNKIYLLKQTPRYDQIASQSDQELHCLHKVLLSVKFGTGTYRGEEYSTHILAH